ncbi:hypothetical protein EJB05_02050, partial [Eragrostis curvula]
MSGVEAAVVSATVSTTLKVVANIIVPLIIKEYTSVVGAEKDLRELHGLVEEINCWLETAGDKAIGSGPSFSWLNRLKDISFDVHDLVDEFQLEADKNEVDGDGRKHTVSRYLRTKPKAFLFQCKAARKIKAIKKRFAEIVKQRTEFSAITNSSHLVRHTNRTTGEMPSLPNADTASVLGRDQEKHQIISKLVETNGQHIIKILSVIGLGGSGKSSLANLVFNDGNFVQEHFKVRLWVHVSQEFDVTKLIEKLFEAIVGEKSERYPLQQMTKIISDELTGKRFLIVLDDVWTDDRILWGEFMVHLKSSVPAGSWVLLTTRSRRVAEVADSAHIFDLPALSESDSWKVFKQSFGMAAKGLDTEFIEVGKEIVNKCGGVPLAIKVLAGVLHDKEYIEEWQAMRDSNLLDVEGKEHRVFACLKLSYFNLPSHLKQCFQICSLFPKGYSIDKEILIDQWIAHDMITPLQGVNCLEHIGHRYFNSLVQMFLLQDLKEGYYGRVTCRLHDLVHDLSRYILGDEISLLVPSETSTSTKSYRYFSLTEKSSDRPPKTIFKKTRAIYVTTSHLHNFISHKALKNATHMRSIIVESVNATTLPTVILQMKYLRYLRISNLGGETLPSAISGIWSLKTLVISGHDLVELPESIGKLQKLRTLDLSWCGKLKRLPDSIGDCPMVRSINLTCCRQLRELPHSIGRNKNLTVLRLGGTSIEKLPTSITSLANLECLDLQLCYLLVELPEGIGNLKKLEVLNLNQSSTRLESMPVGIGQLTRLKRLNLFVVGDCVQSASISELGNLNRISGELRIRGIARLMDLEHVHMARLKEMENLKNLSLEWGRNDVVNAEMELVVFDGLEPPPGIEDLYISQYAGVKFAWWMLKQDGSTVHGLPHFSCLTIMYLNDLPNLKQLQGLVELPCLKKLLLCKMPSLETISGGPFPSLLLLHLEKLSSLKEVWMVTERTLASEEGVCSTNNNNNPNHLGQLQVGSHLSILRMERCPKLKVRPCLPSTLEELHLQGCNEQQMLLAQGQESSSVLSFDHQKLKELVLGDTTSTATSGSGCGLEVLKYLPALEELVIGPFPALLQIPEWLGDLRNLHSLMITDCPGLSSLPQSLENLTSLRRLVLHECTFQQLPQCLWELRSLHRLRLWQLPNLSSLPKSMCHLTSLEELIISDCKELTSLPNEMQGLTALHRLHIFGCPDLQRRCKRGTGEDWHLISHIPDVRV